MTARIRARAVATLALACLVPLVACDGSNGRPNLSPGPTVQPRHPETSLERQTRLDFEAAEKSYRAFMAEYNRLAKSGGADGATPTMKHNAAGPFLAFYADALGEQKQLGQRYTSGVEIGYVRPGAYSSQQLTLEVCENGSKNKVVDENGEQVSSGQILLRSAYARPVGGRWKMWDGDEHGTASSCQS